jgi:hypothetical protein
MDTIEYGIGKTAAQLTCPPVPPRSTAPTKHMYRRAHAEEHRIFPSALCLHLPTLAYSVTASHSRTSSRAKCPDSLQKVQTPLEGVLGTEGVVALLGSAPANWGSAALMSCPRLAMASMSALSCAAVGSVAGAEAKVAGLACDALIQLSAIQHMQAHSLPPFPEMPNRRRGIRNGIK